MNAPGARSRRRRPRCLAAVPLLDVSGAISEVSPAGLSGRRPVALRRARRAVAFDVDGDARARRGGPGRPRRRDRQALRRPGRGAARHCRSARPGPSRFAPDPSWKAASSTRSASRSTASARCCPAARGARPTPSRRRPCAAARVKDAAEDRRAGHRHLLPALRRPAHRHLRRARASASRPCSPCWPAAGASTPW